MSNRTANPDRYVIIAGIWNTWERMVALTDFSAPGGCWNYTSCLNESGYGVFSHHVEGQVLAHRLALHLAHRPVPADMTVDHLCRNRRCVNPAHLEIVTMHENIMRGNCAGAVNARKTHCIRGHEFTPENTYIGKPRNPCGGPTRQCKQCARDRYVNSRSAA